MSRYSRNAASVSMASALTWPPPSAVAILTSSYGSGGTSKSCAMPWRPSTSTSSTLRPPAASASASAAAMVDLPVPPLPVTKCRRALVRRDGQPTGLPPFACGSHPCMLTKRGSPTDKLSHMSEPTRWEYATVPLLTHATKQILDQWGEDGWELVSVLPGPTGEQHVAYLKRPK